MHRSVLLALLLGLSLLSGCSDPSAPQPAVESSSAPGALAPAPLESEPGAMHAKIEASGISSEYAAYFMDEQLVRIVEQRQIPNAALEGEYTFKGARLLTYRGAKVADTAALDLQFDMQGRLLSGQGPNVSEEEIAAVRGRAQLLRSHALAQRATKMH